MPVNIIAEEGRLGHDPEVRFLPNGTSVCNFSIGQNVKWGDKEHTNWFPVVTFGRLADIVGEYLHQGSRICPTGELQSRNWEDKDGGKHTTIEIRASKVNFLDPKDVSKAKEVLSEGGVAEEKMPEDDSEIPF
jgi:single-strand DNA-binding protein